MKFLWALLLMTSIAYPALAADEKNNSFVMVNGKKFFLMRNARVFSGNKKPMPASFPKQEWHNNVPVLRSGGALPKPIQTNQAISIPPLNISPAGTAPMSAMPAGSNPVIKVAPGAAAPANNVPVIPGNNAVNNGTPNGKAAADVLSIFEPQQGR